MKPELDPPSEETAFSGHQLAEELTSQTEASAVSDDALQQAIETEITAFTSPNAEYDDQFDAIKNIHQHFAQQPDAASANRVTQIIFEKAFQIPSAYTATRLIDNLCLGNSNLFEQDFVPSPELREQLIDYIVNEHDTFGSSKARLITRIPTLLTDPNVRRAYIDYKIGYWSVDFAQ